MPLVAPPSRRPLPVPPPSLAANPLRQGQRSPSRPPDQPANVAPARRLAVQALPTPPVPPPSLAALPVKRPSSRGSWITALNRHENC
ncbi:MAG TPA: hypothetical protein VH599_14320 [Ktedonobacterales bacterium]